MYVVIIMIHNHAVEMIPSMTQELTVKKKPSSYRSHTEKVAWFTSNSYTPTVVD